MMWQQASRMMKPTSENPNITSHAGGTAERTKQNEQNGKERPSKRTQAKQTEQNNHGKTARNEAKTEQKPRAANNRRKQEGKGEGPEPRDRGVKDPKARGTAQEE